jgi:hypothetical protein
MPPRPETYPSTIGQLSIFQSNDGCRVKTPLLTAQVGGSQRMTQDIIMREIFRDIYWAPPPGENVPMQQEGKADLRNHMMRETFPGLAE